MSSYSNGVVRIGVLGAGHWGPNLIRNFISNERSRVVAIADTNAGRREAVLARYPGVDGHDRAESLLARDDLDAVVIATPTATHHRLAVAALARGLHVLVEKPLARTTAEAEELGRIAADAGLVLLTGHVFLFHEAVRTVRRLIDDGELGRVQYIQSVRTNLGPIRTDVSALWDLAAHDVSIFHYWLNGLPSRVTGKGGIYVNKGIEDVVFATLEYPGGVLANLHATWLSPNKLRQITVVGEQRMLVFDDMNLAEPVRIYDKGVAPVTEPGCEESYPIVDSFVGFRSSIRDGEISVPLIPAGEPLRAECEHFLDCIVDGARPLSGAAESIAVVRVLEAVERSLRAGSAEQHVS
ncbi:MAG TPA: Gfo/Idh/MocA family oxidoreductase [Candidatus Limnocylindrales bacterium]|nr:Gfo/Idh/MocA family oxidoreductase [Candidatus Limnocylindrales bacterium]